MAEPIVAPSASRHGVSEETIRHAFNNPVRACDLDDGFTMLVGPDQAGNLYEIGVSIQTMARLSFMRCERGRDS